MTKGSLLQEREIPNTSRNTEKPMATAPKSEDVSAPAVRIDPPKLVALESV